MSLIQGNTKVSAAGGYTIDQSIRFNDNDSAYLSRTSGATGDRQKWTFSTWVKRGNLSSNQRLFHDSGNTNFIMFGFSSNNEFRVYLGAELRTTALFRDPSAWYHLVVAVDTTQATSSDRVKIYQNGVQITSFSATGYPSLNYNTIFNNSGTTYQISGQSVSEYFDGYISEFHWIDGQALAPTDFGETNNDGVWIPKRYAGTYGTNGFYLKGQDSSNLGDDSSGNGNDFTSSGLTSDDQRGDTPTANQSVFNLLDQNGTSNIGTFSDGNLTLATSSNDSLAATSIPVIESGCYWEAKIDSAGDEMFGLWVSSTKPLRSASTSSPHIDAASCVIRVATNTVYNEGSGSSFSPATISANDVVMFAYKNGQFFYGKNGAWENSGDPVAETGELFTITSSSSKVIVPVFGRSGGGNVTYTLHMSEEDFTYTAPAGYVALSTANLPAPTITDGSAYFQTTLYTGDGNSTQTITQSENSTFNPDLVWIKNRSNGYAHNVNDAVRGYTGSSPATYTDVKVLASNATDREGLGDSLTTAIQRGFVQSSTSNGFIVNKGTAGSQDGFYTNASGHTYAAWQWLAANGTASNTNGSITSTVSANTTAGFSIVSWTAQSGTYTIGHGLGATPTLIITKNRDISGGPWLTFTTVIDGSYDYLSLDTTAAKLDDPFGTALPTSSVFSGTVNYFYSSGRMIAYCFAEVEGFSKFGKYTGNGSTDGPFIWCGFRPAFVISKRTDSADNWAMYDAARDPYNVAEKYLYADATNAEATFSTAKIDFLSNGFKWRGAVNFGNASGGTYIFMAFAEHPFGGSGVAPVPAR